MFIDYQFFFAFLVFALVSSITPGPNNVMLLSSGVNFGFRRSIPHLLGVTFGFSAMIFIVGLGLGEVFAKYPMLFTILRYASGVYLLYLAWQIARTKSISEDESKQPISFWQAVAFQWINPKAWVMGIAAITTYASKEHFFISIAAISIIFIFFVAPSGFLWNTFGNWFRRYLLHPLHLRIFNISMAILLVLSLYPLLQEIR